MRKPTVLALCHSDKSNVLIPEERPIPSVEPGHLLLRISACGVCRTDLHILDNELPHIKKGVIPGHEIVGVVVDRGANTEGFPIGQRVGVPWLGWTCGTCHYCKSGHENLCDAAKFTGYTLDGGYAEYILADSRYCFPIPEFYSDAEAAPLLCAGLIGYRSLSMVDDAQRIGIYGFGAAAHLVTQVARFQHREVYAFTSPGDIPAQEFALSLGACWAGASTASAPVALDAAIIFAPVGNLVPLALRAVVKGGVVVCGGIHMSDIPSFRYELLWGERTIRSVANLTRRDGEEFFKLAPTIPIRTTVETFPMQQANKALQQLRRGKLRGAAVLINQWQQQ